LLESGIREVSRAEMAGDLTALVLVGTHSLRDHDAHVWILVAFGQQLGDGLIFQNTRNSTESSAESLMVGHTRSAERCEYIASDTSCEQGNLSLS
jgi:hypothetical protein